MTDFTPTLQQLLTVLPAPWVSPARALKVSQAYPYLVQAAQAAAIITPERACHFYSQLAHESEGFAILEELWGPTPQQLKYEPGYETPISGRQTLAQQLGNTQPGDGFRFRGRGYIETTGRANYMRIGSVLSIDSVNHPELLSEPLGAALSSALFWNDHKLNQYADSPGDPKVAVIAITKRINGGLTGLIDRLNLFNACYRAWCPQQPSTTTTSNICC